MYLHSLASELCSSVLSLVGFNPLWAYRGQEDNFMVTFSENISNWQHQRNPDRLNMGEKGKKTQKNLHTVYKNLPHIFGSCEIPLFSQKSRILILYTLRCCFWIFSLHKIVEKSTKSCSPIFPTEYSCLLEKRLENPIQIMFSYQPIRWVDILQSPSTSVDCWLSG